MKNISSPKSSAVTRFRAKSTLEKLLKVALGTIVTSLAIASPKADAADMYGFPNLNGKIVKLELSNGVRVNLPQSRAIDNYNLNSFVPDNTDDWKWRVVDDGSGVTFIRVNTNKAFTVYDLKVADLTPIVAWEYQGHSRYHDWNPEPLKGGYHLIHLRHKPGQCLNIPGSRSEQWVTTYACNANDPDQRFKIEVVGDTAPPPPRTIITPPLPPVITPPPRAITTLPIKTPTTPLYEYWIVARKGSGGVDPGHAFTAIVKKDRFLVKQIVNGVPRETYEDASNWYPWHTYGFWPQTIGGVIPKPAGFPGDLQVDNSCTTKNSSDCPDLKDTKNIIAGIPISTGGQAIRKAKISESRANWINNNRNFGKCATYDVAGKWVGPGSSCNCATYSILQWYYITANRENLMPSVFSIFDFPSDLVDKINSKNQTTGNQFIDNGNTWQ